MSPSAIHISTMASIHNTVSAIRSQIFNTIHNPTNARTGAKYLRKPLRGSAIVKYYPKLPKLATLNSRLPNNKYANWTGTVAGSSSRQQIEASTSTSAEGEKVASEENVEVGNGGRSVARQLRTSEEIHGLDYSEAERREGAGWLMDDKERVRLMETTLRHKLGKGPPKKGTSFLLSRNGILLDVRNELIESRSRKEIADEEEVEGKWECGADRGSMESLAHFAIVDVSIPQLDIKLASLPGGELIHA
jgi:hypothetical protein